MKRGGAIRKTVWTNVLGYFGRMMFRLSVLLLAFCLTHLVAQESRGTIVGTVSDSSGAVIAGANVEVLNVEMGTKAVLSTNASG